MLDGRYRRRNTLGYTARVEDEYRWPEGQTAELHDALTTREVVDALYAPTSLRLDNRTPEEAPVLLVVCAPTDDERLIVVVCVRAQTDQIWTIFGARDARATERTIWRRHTS